MVRVLVGHALAWEMRSSVRYSPNPRPAPKTLIDNFPRTSTQTKDLPTWRMRPKQGNSPFDDTARGGMLHVPAGVLDAPLTLPPSVSISISDYRISGANPSAFVPCSSASTLSPLASQSSLPPPPSSAPQANPLPPAGNLTLAPQPNNLEQRRAAEMVRFLQRYVQFQQQQQQDNQDPKSNSKNLSI